MGPFCSELTFCNGVDIMNITYGYEYYNIIGIKILSK